MPSSLLNRQSVTTPVGSALQIAPFKYVPPPGNTAVEVQSAEEPSGPKRSATQQRVVDLSNAGNYKAASQVGVELLKNEKADDALQLIIANSLAWTGQLKQAIPAYEKLTKGELANAANIGLANIENWRGNPEKAAPMFRAVLATEPNSTDAIVGLAQAERELRPKTSLTFGGTKDSSVIESRVATLNHRWRDESTMNVMEVETSGVRNWKDENQTDQRDVTFRYQALGLELKPSFEISMPTKADRSLYGGVRLSFNDAQETLDFGYINWSKTTVNPDGLAANLGASRIGAGSRRNYPFGDVSARVDLYSISDSNRIWTANVQLNSSWRPVGNNVKPFIGAENRTATFNTSNYWSPINGSGTLYGGLLGEWGVADWSLYASAQLSMPIYGDAGSGWAASAGGKRWITSDIALSMNLWAMSSWRDSATYRSQSANVTVEKLW
ncbi:tetratricopeptide repeat protein [Rhodoferax aquaticus]|uniref:Tetratricopeptide repeat protein n=1 Tax=Rhodoferax aquaticus TaxID=2527691 RepID=A0A515EK95_9BURK|nr:hypothetical protein [Rhodoferax aquaticus]QDL53087.1 hypothetical protein EXZ61_02270 [Rhodoferax aquaticus]